MLNWLKEFSISRLYGHPPPSKEERAAVVRIQWKDNRILLLYSLILCIAFVLPMAITTGAAAILWPGSIDKPIVGNDRILMKAIGAALLLFGGLIGLLIVHRIERKANPAQSFRQTLRQLFYPRTAKDILAELRAPKKS